VTLRGYPVALLPACFSSEPRQPPRTNCSGIDGRFGPEYAQWVREKAVQEHKRGKRVRRISEELGVPRTTLSRWIRAFKTKEARIAAAMRAILVACRQRAAEARETLAELVGRASRALGFKAKCKLVSSRTNVLLCYAKSEGHVTWSVPLL